MLCNVAKYCLSMVLVMGAFVPSLLASADEKMTGNATEGVAGIGQEEQEQKQELNENNDEENLIDEAHAIVSGGVIFTGRWIDSFFATERYEDEENKTSLVLRFSEFVDEEGNDFKVRAKVRLRTPNLNKRLKFFFIGEEGGIEPALTAVERVEEAFESTDEDSITAGLYYRYRDTVQKNIRLKTGMRLRDSKLIYFVEPRFRWRERLDAWKMNMYFIQKVGWFSDNGFDVKTRFDFERPLTPYHLIRTTVEGNWYEDLDGYFYNIIVQYNHLLSQHKGLYYQWNNAFILDSDSFLNATVLQLVYRQRLRRDWLSLEIAPQLNYPRDNNFEAAPGLFLRLDVRFDNGGAGRP